MIKRGAVGHDQIAADVQLLEVEIVDSIAHHNVDGTGHGDVVKAVSLKRVPTPAPISTRKFPAKLIGAGFVSKMTWLFPSPRLMKTWLVTPPDGHWRRCRH